MPNATDILASITSLWRRQFKLADEAKHDRFGRVAERCWDFLGEDYDKLYIPPPDEEFMGEPDYKLRRNLTFDFVATFLPFVFHQVPHRLVTPSRHEPPPELSGMPPGMPLPQNPLALQDKLRAWLMQWWLNYTPVEYDLRGESRRAVIEALVKGRGVVWIEMVRGSYGLVPAAKYGSVDDLLIDPDCERDNEAGWIDRKQRASVWRLAEEFGIPREDLYGQDRSFQARAITEEEEPASSEDSPDDTLPPERRGDVVERHTVWTRGLGVGQKLLGTDDHLRDLDKGIGRLAGVVESLNHCCRLVIAPGVPYPLNLPPWVLETATEAELKYRLAWPIRFEYEPSNPWPMAPLDFYPGTDSPWPTSPLKAALPLQEFIDRTFSFMMTRVRSTSRTIHVADKSLEKDFIEAMESGPDQIIVFLEGRNVEDITKLIAQFEFGQLGQDLPHVLGMVEVAFEKSTGMTAIIQGSEGRTQIRSASEAQMRQGHSMNRPQEMAQCVEAWGSQVARAEGFAARTMVAPNVVAPLFGEATQQTILGTQHGPYTQAWSQLVNAEPYLAAAELSYEIEAGSGQRKNKQQLMANAEMLMQAMGQMLFQYAAINPQPWNALVRFFGEAFDTRLDDMMLAPPPPMLAGPGQAPGQGPPQNAPAGPPR